MAPPIAEILVNVLILTGGILNIFITIHFNESWLLIAGNLPIIVLGILMLAGNQADFIQSEAHDSFQKRSQSNRVAWKLLHLKPAAQTTKCNASHKLSEGLQMCRSDHLFAQLKNRFTKYK